MELLQATYLQTATQIVLNSNTITADNLMDPDIKNQYITSGFADDSLTSTITINFDSTQTIDRIGIMENNWKQFNIYYGGVTANALTLTSPTTTSQFITNAAGNLYLACTPVAVTSLTFDIKKTMVANSEKAVGYIYVGANQFTFTRIPSASNYKPMIDAKELLHTLSDGGTRRQTVQTKQSAKIKLKFISDTMRSSLYDIYSEFTPKVFVPFGTGTGWDGILFEANWIGDFDGNNYADDNQSAGFNVSIDLKET